MYTELLKIKLKGLGARVPVFVSLFLLSFSFQTLNAQIEKKINYQRLNNKKGILGPAFLGIFSREYDRQFGKLYRAYGDDSLSSDSNDNAFQVVHQRNDLSFFDITDVEFLSDSTVDVSGTFYLQKFDLDSEEMSKNFIVRDVINPETDMMVRTLVKVHHSSTGQPYIKEWHHSQSVVLHDSDIVSIDVKNRNRWVANKGVIERKLLGYNYTQVAVGTVFVIVGIPVIIKMWVDFRNRK